MYHFPDSIRDYGKGMASLCLFAIACIIWQRLELKKFQVTHYKMSSKKINKKLKMAVISDLHAFSYGSGNGRLLHAILREKPDVILIPGDLIVTSVSKKYEVAAHFVEQLCASGVPVLYSNGNHETRAELPDAPSHLAYMHYRSRLEKAGLAILNNESLTLTANGVRLRVSGVELPLESYQKGKTPYLEETFLTRKLGMASEECLQVLLAHNPAFAKQYAAWGADITVCGHNHGGLVRIPGVGSIISPQFMLFPKYDAGECSIHGKKVYISRGLGTHTFHIRVCNRAELVVITAEPKQEE